MNIRGKSLAVTCLNHMNHHHSVLTIENHLVASHIIHPHIHPPESYNIHNLTTTAHLTPRMPPYKIYQKMLQ